MNFTKFLKFSPNTDLPIAYRNNLALKKNELLIQQAEEKNEKLFIAFSITEALFFYNIKKLSFWEKTLIVHHRR